MKFEILRSKSIQLSKIGEYFWFVLKANNNEIIASSEMYNSKQSCLKGIAAVKKCLFAKVIDNSKHLTE